MDAANTSMKKLICTRTHMNICIGYIHGSSQYICVIHPMCMCLYEHMYSLNPWMYCVECRKYIGYSHAATHCNTLQHTARHCNSKYIGYSHTAAHGNTLQHTATHGDSKYIGYSHTATHCHTLQHTATHTATANT